MSERANINMGMIAFLDDDAIVTNEMYLFEFCKIALYQNGYIGLTIEELQEAVRSISLFDYSLEEIETCVDSHLDSEIESFGDKYYLTSDTEKELVGRKKSFHLRNYIDDYCDKFIVEKVDRNYLCDLMAKFVLEKFQESIEQIGCVLELNTKDILYSADYSDDDITFINGFLVWDNEGKNEIIYKLILKSYDFCEINCPKSIAFDFGHYDFFLDSNIIMRYMGINNERRKKAVEQFIEKCKKNGINLLVSNFCKRYTKFHS